MTRQALALVALVVAVVVAAVVLAGPVVRYWKGRAADAEAGQEHALDAGEASALEVEGTRNIEAQAAAYRGAVLIIREQAHDLDLETAVDVDASTTLPAGVRDRIARGDVGLCDSGVACRSRSGPASD